VNEIQPSFGEVWQADLDPVRGHEQAGKRPVLVLSMDPFNHGPADLVIVAPISTKNKGIRTHIQLDPQEGGLRQRSFVLCDALRSISKERLSKRLGAVSGSAMQQVQNVIRVLMGL